MKFVILRLSVLKGGAAQIFMSQISIHEFSLPMQSRFIELPWLFPGNQPQHFRRLNEAHPDLKLDPFLVWQLSVCAARLG